MKLQSGALSGQFHECVRVEDAIAQTPLAPADILLVLGNRAKGASRELARLTSRLFKAGYAPQIIVSGGAIDKEGQLEAGHMSHWLQKFGVPTSAIYMERLSTNTKENVVFSRDIAQFIPGVPRNPNVIVIGQRFASRRILMTMAAQWPEATPMIASVCLMGAPVQQWPENPAIMDRVASEARKIEEYKARGDIADVDVHALSRRIHALRNLHKVHKLGNTLAHA